MAAMDVHPVESTLIITPHDKAPRTARRFAKEVASDALDPTTNEILGLLVSELVTAAIGDRDAVLRMSVVVNREVVRVELLDASMHDLPTPSIPTEVEMFRARILGGLADGTGADMGEDGCLHWLELRRESGGRG